MNFADDYEQEEIYFKDSERLMWKNLTNSCMLNIWLEMQFQSLLLVSNIFAHMWSNEVVNKGQASQHRKPNKQSKVSSNIADEGIDINFERCRRCFHVSCGVVNMQCLLNWFFWFLVVSVVSHSILSIWNR